MALTNKQQIIWTKGDTSDDATNRLRTGLKELDTTVRIVSLTSNVTLSGVTLFAVVENVED